MDFDFLSEHEPKEPLIPEVVHRGPNTADVKKMTRKRLIQDCLDAYEILGGITYLVQQAQADPKEYFKIIAKLIPTNIGLDSDEITILLQDQFNNKAIITNSNKSPLQNRDLGREGTEPSLTSSGEAPLIADNEVTVKIKDRY